MFIACRKFGSRCDFIINTAYLVAVDLTARCIDIEMRDLESSLSTHILFDTDADAQACFDALIQELGAREIHGRGVAK